MVKKLWQSLIVLFCSSLLSWGCVSTSAIEGQLFQPNQRHILERLTFGINSTLIAQVDAQGVEAYIQSQLNPKQLEENPDLEKYLAGLELISQPTIEVQKKHSQNRQKFNQGNLSAAEKQAVDEITRNLNIQSRQEAMNAKLARSIYSSRQLQEVMVDFWFNHFNVYTRKGVINLWVGDYENQIRKNALGSFRDLLEVTARHPAMLIYLDNERNTASNNPGQKKDLKNINENYARELMELHTLGVNGGYTQKDITELSRIFTGWGVDYFGHVADEHGFNFYANLHDPDEKVFLGHKIEPQGIEEGRKALDILASHPATAKFISYKLAQFFISDRPPSQLVDLLAQKFLDSNGDIKTVLDTLIHSQEFNDSQYYDRKFKTPYQYLVSLARISEVQQPNYERLRNMLYHLGMPIYMYDSPTGYGNTEADWLNPQGVLQRIGYGSAIAKGALNNEVAPQYELLAQNMGKLSSSTQKVIADNPPEMHSTLLLGSPEAMYR